MTPLPAAQHRPERTQVDKPPVGQTLFSRDSALGKYRAVFIGRSGWGALLTYEVVTAVCATLRGALGYALRNATYPWVFNAVGRQVLWGRNIGLRHPGKIRVGDRVVVDDHCLLDARGAGTEGMRIGNDVVVARSTILQCKAGPITIGDRCVIGSQCQLSSVSGIQLGRAVMLAGQCYVGGGRYQTEDPNVPIMDQGVYTKGPVVLEDGVWVGAGVIIQDGVRIGAGSVIGAGAVIREDVPPKTVVAAHQRLVLLPRIPS